MTKDAKKEDKKEDKKEKPKTKEEELQNKIKEMQLKEKDLIETLQRLQAEFENYKKRVDKDKEIFCTFARADMIKKLLPVADAFELALKNIEKKEEFAKGIELVYAEFISTLKKEGLREIEAKGRKFDPHLHEVLLSEKSDKEDGTILEELQKGYMLSNFVIRHSKVKVAKNDGKKNEDQNKDQQKNASG